MRWQTEPKLEIDRKYSTDEPEIDKDGKPKYCFAWQEDLDFIILYENEIFDMYNRIIKAKKEYKQEEK